VRRILICALVCSATAARPVGAQDGIRRGTLKSVDAAEDTVTFTARPGAPAA
jgi:hypothetical protein